MKKIKISLACLAIAGLFAELHEVGQTFFHM